jgi:metallo-beta-lactamase family protein
LTKSDKTQVDTTMKISIEFLGATRTVTGSKYLVRAGSKTLLIDSGSFQGDRELTELNWAKTAFDPRSVDAVLLTHAHIDHIGMLPRYYSQGLQCPVYCTGATKELAKVLLADTGRLQEQEADYRRERKKSRYKNPLPLYTEKEAIGTNKLLKGIAFNTPVSITKGITATWHQAGHILGAAIINLNIGDSRITFSGDLGRYAIPILNDPKPVELGSLLLIESTYATKEHPDSDTAVALAGVINKAYQRDGALLIPSFAVGRAQLLLYYIRDLKERKLIPDVPVYVDSPMAIDATEIHRNHPECYDDETLGINSKGAHPFSFQNLHFVRDVESSIALNSQKGPIIIIAGSGMLNGGRILHHIKNRISNPATSILFVGHQPVGGRGAYIQNGAKCIKIFGSEYPLRASVDTISGLSAHADHSELLRWATSCSGTPTKVAVVHGEEDSCLQFADELSSKFQWNTIAPRLGEVLDV